MGQEPIARIVVRLINSLLAVDVITVKSIITVAQSATKLEAQDGHRVQPEELIKVV